MTAAALALVVAAAVLHASWNALAKRSGDPVAFFCLASVFAVLVLAAPATWIVARDGIRAAAVPFVVATIALHGLYFGTLARAYGAGAYSMVYPVARGLGVALVPVVAVATLHERVSSLGALGIGLVVAGIVAVQFAAGSRPAGTPSSALAGLGWAAATGVVIACYSLVDKAGVAHLHPVPYLVLIEAGTVACLLPAARRRRGALAQEWRAQGRAIVAAGAMSGLAYLLVLFCFQLSKAAYVVASRELSIVFSAVIGSLWLGEGRLGPRLAAASVVLAGVLCVALAR